MKYYRKKNNISQAKLAELCNVSAGTIGSIESGIIKPSFELMVLIATKLNIEPAELLKKNNSTENPFTKFQIKKLCELQEKINLLISEQINSLKE